MLPLPRFARVYLLFLLLFTVPLPLTFGASIRGRVLDPQGGLVKASIITVYQRDSATRFKATSKEDGSFRFDRLRPGDYVLEAEAQGFARSEAYKLHLAADTDAEFELFLRLIGPREEIVVTASGTPQSVDEVSKAVTLVGRPEVDERNEYSIGEALRHVPGLRVQQLGGPGALMSIKTRGLRNEDTAVLIDGLRLRDVAAPQGDASGLLEDLIVTDVDRIEVLRGSGSSLYGSNAIGGVINIVSEEGGGRTRGSLGAEGGSLGLFRSRAQVAGGWKQDRLTYSLGLTHLNVSRGVDEDDAARNSSIQGRLSARVSPRSTLSGRVYAADSFLQLNNTPEAVGTLPAAPILAAVALPLAELRRYENGTPISQLNIGSANYLPSANDPDNRRLARFFSGAVIWNHQPSDKIGYTLTYQGLTTDRSNPNGPAGVGFQEPGNTNSEFDGRIHTLNAQGNLQLGRVQTIQAGIEFEHETFINRTFPVQLSDRSSVEARQRSASVFVQDQMRWLEGRLQVSAAVRTQFFSLKTPEFVPSTDAPYQGVGFTSPPTAYTGDGSVAYFFRSTGTKLRAHAGNGYRAPSLYERYGTFFSSFGYFVFGDPRLRPDRSIAFDAGFDQTLAAGRVRASGTYFYTRLQEIVVFDFSGAINPVTDPFGRFGGYRNNHGGLARGVEVSAAVDPTSSVSVTAAYSYTNADQREPVLPGIIRSLNIPDHQFSLVALQRFGSRTAVSFDFIASSDYLSPIFNPATFSSRAFQFDGIVKADLSVSHRIPLSDLRSLRLHLRLENVFDRTYYESGYRTPGVAAAAGLQFEF
ncbi:MAG: TonB-dependent receptor [Acidobacteriota bacterium]